MTERNLNCVRYSKEKRHPKAYNDDEYEHKGMSNKPAILRISFHTGM